ncbi:MAG: ImmA/IrrE family metallo-endopeptidase [Caulobacteraceae bacterium]|nr:ImmA/IrrE family metallo-endopeptidase [Caulobacteraceae bacterium]
MPRVNPENLRWARETAGFAEADAAKRIGLNAAYGIAPGDRLRGLETGEWKPSRRLLSKMAAAYRRPLLAFYLPRIPRQEPRVEDFRSLPDRRPESEPLVQALVRDLRARQALVLGVLEDEESPPISLVGAHRMTDGSAAVARAIVEFLGFRLERFRACANPDLAFTYLRERAEAAGVFVLLIGDLGSHHTEIEVESFRGFALADPIAPFVAVNDRDAHTAWAFTLLHELAHIALGITGVSGAHVTAPIERFCNDVASRILLPPAEVATLGVDVAAGFEAVVRQTGAAARPLRLSRTLIAFRLFESGAIDEATWEALRTTFAEEWRAARAARRKSRVPDGGGPDFYVVRRQRLGRALLALVARAVAEGTLTAIKAGKVLGVHARSVDPLIRPQAA